MAKSNKPTDEDDADGVESGDPKKGKDRSPNYPVVGLEKAVELAEKVEKKYGSHDVPIHLVHELWEYKAHSGSGNQAVAALKAYGLVAVDGKGEKRKVKLTPEAIRIVHKAPDRIKLLEIAAKSPPIHQELLEQYKSKGLPDDTLLAQELVWERPEGKRFNRDTVGVFIERFKNTLAYAGVTVGGTISNTHESQDGGENNGDPPPPLQAPNPRERRRQMVAGTKEDVFSLDEGPVVLTWPERLSKVSAQDLKDWLQLIGRKIERAASVVTEDDLRDMFKDIEPKKADGE